jgi:hypothetical protein
MLQRQRLQAGESVIEHRLGSLGSLGRLGRLGKLGKAITGLDVL